MAFSPLQMKTRARIPQVVAQAPKTAAVGADPQIVDTPQVKPNAAHTTPHAQFAGRAASGRIMPTQAAAPHPTPKACPTCGQAMPS